MWDKQKQREEEKLLKLNEIYRRKNELRMKECPPEFIKDLKKLHDLGALDELGDDYVFSEDNIIYKFFDTYEGFVEDVEINTETMWFSMLPNKERTEIVLEIGETSGVFRHHLKLNESNKDALLGFWAQWKNFRDLNPELYNSRYNW